MQLLLLHGANYNPRKDGGTPLGVASTMGHVEVILLLLRFGASHATDDDDDDLLVTAQAESLYLDSG